MRKQMAVLSLVMAGLMAACAPLQPTDGTRTEPRQQLRVDADVLYTMSVTELVHTRIEQASGDSLLKIQFAIKARDTSDFEWQVTWFNADGIVVPSIAAGYRRAHVVRGQVRYFSAIAPSTDVVDFQLHLREKRE